MKNNLLFFAFGLILGLFASLFYHRFFEKPPSPRLHEYSVEEVMKQAKQEEAYSKSIDSLEKRSSRLSVTLNQTKAALTIAKQKSSTLQKQVFDLLDKRFEAQNTDTVLAVMPPDTLEATFSDLVSVTVTKDNLFDSVITKQETQLRNKDSMLVAKDQLYAHLQGFFNQSIAEKETLQFKNETLFKQYKKQKRKTTLYSVALLLLTGAAGSYLLQH